MAPQVAGGTTQQVTGGTAPPPAPAEAKPDLPTLENPFFKGGSMRHFLERVSSSEPNNDNFIDALYRHESPKPVPLPPLSRPDAPVPDDPPPPIEVLPEAASSSTVETSAPVASQAASSSSPGAKGKATEKREQEAGSSLASKSFNASKVLQYRALFDLPAFSFSAKERP